MYILDTDLLSLLQLSDSADGIRLRQRLEATSVEFTTTIITFEEHVGGWLSAIASAKRMVHLVAAYRRLMRLLSDYQGITILPFDEAAGEIFEQLRRSKVRIGTRDLRIASIALARNEILLTRNTKDFSKVPNLKFEDWCR